MHQKCKHKITWFPELVAAVLTSQQLQSNITLMTSRCDENCLFESCIFNLEDLHTNNVTCDMSMALRDELIDDLSFPFLSPILMNAPLAIFCLSLCFLIFIMVYPIDYAQHQSFSIIWNVLSIYLLIILQYFTRV